MEKLSMHLSPRCKARTRSETECRSPAMPNGRCRLHGGLSSGAPRGNRNAFKHGHWTAEEIASRREFAELRRIARDLGDVQIEQGTREQQEARRARL